MTNRGQESHRRQRVQGLAWPWVGVVGSIVVVVAVAFGAALALSRSGSEPTSTTSPTNAATMFELPTSTGSSFALDAALAESDVLLYFSMGIGCDTCFAQIPEVSDALTARGITLVPIMVQDPDAVNMVAQQWGIGEPIVIDADLAVSEAYGMIGINDHMDSPFHSIALVKQDGSLALVKHYSSMFVGLDDMMDDIASVS